MSKWSGFTRVNRILVAVLILVLGSLRAEASDSQIDQALADPGFNWESISAGHVHLYYLPGQFADRHRVMLLRSARAALETGLRFLDQKPENRDLRVLYVADRGQMEALIGHTYSGFADMAGHGVFLVCNAEWRSFDTHEITHLLTLGRWGDPSDQSGWMVEGLPIAVDGLCQDADVDRIAAYLAAQGRWPGIFEYQIDPREKLGEVASGSLAGSFIRYLRKEYGPEVLENVWKSGLVQTLEDRGADAKEVEKHWLERLRRLDRPLTDEEWEEIETKGCG